MGRNIWLTLPLLLTILLIFPVLVLSDALPGAIRIVILRYLGICILLLVGFVWVVLRLPLATEAPGIREWSIMGVQGITNLQVVAQSSTILFAMLFEGVWTAWRRPDHMAFVRGEIQLERHFVRNNTKVGIEGANP